MTSVSSCKVKFQLTNETKMTTRLTCNVEVSPFVQAEPGSPTAFLLLSLFSMAHLFCAGQDFDEINWTSPVTWLIIDMRQ